jgi:hypothetical protein
VVERRRIATARRSRRQRRPEPELPLLVRAQLRPEQVRRVAARQRVQAELLPGLAVLVPRRVPVVLVRAPAVQAELLRARVARAQVRVLAWVVAASDSASGDREGSEAERRRALRVV